MYHSKNTIVHSCFNHAILDENSCIGAMLFFTDYWCSTRHEESFPHSKHAHTHRKAATNKHPTYICQIHCKLYQRTQICLLSYNFVRGHA